MHGRTLNWEKTSVLDKKGLDLLALHIQMAPVDECINKGRGLEIPDCWTVDVVGCDA